MAKFVNIAHESDSVPNIINVDDIVRIRPGLVNSNWSGRDEACTIYLRLVIDEVYEPDFKQREPLVVEVHLSTTEICRRLRTDIFIV
jgi:hypothetical protein